MNQRTVQPQPVYQGHIDGLRAIAVLAVIANHYSKDFLPGGYLGVDVFFVISGYVITASLSARPRTNFGAFLLEFFRRRIKRLLPALIVCVLLTSLFISALDPAPRTSLITGISAVFGLSNLYLYQLSIDYFAPAAQSNAFTQTWSLGVEEQFYLLFPTLFWLTTKRSAGSSNSTLVWVIFGLSLLSFSFFAVLFQTQPGLAYFFTPLRFWELGAGCIFFAAQRMPPLAWLGHHVRKMGPLPILLLLACFWIPADQLVLASAAVVLLTGFLLADTDSHSLTRKGLSWGPLRHIGLISYSLYLWHWTVFVVARWTVGVNDTNIVWLLIAMLALAEISYRWVETPWRHRPGGWPAVTGLAVSCFTAFALVVLVFKHEHLLLEVNTAVRTAPAFLPVKGKPYDPHCVADGEKRKLEDGNFDLCTFAPRVPGGQTIWAMGDSHAGHLQGLLYRLHETRGIGVHLIETPDRPYPYRGPVFEPRERIVSEMYARSQPGDVLLVSRLFLDRSSVSPMADLVPWTDNLKELATQLASRDMQLVVVGPPPMFDFDDTVVCLRPNFSSTTCKRDRTELANSVTLVEQLLKQQLSGLPNAHVFSSFDVLCPATQSRCAPIHDGLMRFRDRDHLNSAGSALLADPLFAFLQGRNLTKPRALEDVSPAIVPSTRPHQD